MLAFPTSASVVATLGVYLIGLHAVNWWLIKEFTLVVLCKKKIIYLKKLYRIIRGEKQK